MVDEKDEFATIRGLIEGRMQMQRDGLKVSPKQDNDDMLAAINAGLGIVERFLTALETIAASPAITGIVTTAVSTKGKG